MSFGVEADEQVSARMFGRVREAGINFFDTADVYGGGASEENLGKLIADCRDEVVIASKVFYPTRPDMNAQGLSRRHIVRAVEASLKRLGTEWIDFYFVHAFDERTPIEQTLRALDDLRRQRKILYPAISNWAAWQIATALGISAKEGLARFELEPMYNLVKRQAEVEILPLAAAENLVSSPTARSAPACSPASTPAAHARRAGGWSTTPATAWTATSPPQTGSRPSRRRSASSPRPSPWPGRCRTRPSPRRSSARATRTAGGLTRRSGRRDDR